MSSKSERGLSDFLLYDYMLAPGIMRLKNGAYMCGARIQGPDIESSSKQDMEWISAAANHATMRLEDGWMLNYYVCRSLSNEYPDAFFSEPTNALIDRARYGQFTSVGAHYETYTFLFLTWLPPAHSADGKAQKVSDFLMGRTADDEISYVDRDIKHFEEVISAFLTSFSQNMKYRRLTVQPDGTDELLHAINLIMNQAGHPCLLPDPPSHLDTYFARELENGEFFRYDGKDVAVLTTDRLPTHSYPGILSDVELLPMDLLYSVRFIVTDEHYARDKIGSDRKKWAQKMQPFIAKMVGNNNARVDQHAVQMVHELDEAAALVEQGSVYFGHYTSTVILRAEDQDDLQRKIRDVQKLFERKGFQIRVERRNAVDAFMGSLPGHGRENVRKPFIHSLNFADLSPMQTMWAGSTTCPCPPPNFPAGSPPLMMVSSIGTTPFRFNLHVDDVGHTLILGPTGAGKSTLLALIASQWERYPNAQTFVFDKGMSMFALTKACFDAVHYDLGNIGTESMGGLCPLAEIDDEAERGWATDYLDTLLQLQLTMNTADTVGAEDRNLLRDAINIMASATERPEQRTMTNFLATVQSSRVRNLLRYYQGSGVGGRFLDGKSNDITYKRMVTFEIEALMNLDKAVMIPVLLYLFHQIERRLTGAPTLLIIDEAWLALDTPVFAAKIREWLKVFRKSNCSIVLATQQVGDISNSPMIGALVESCPTKIFLPNRDAKTEASSVLYKNVFGLNDTQIDLIANAQRKRQYYYSSPAGRRLFDLVLGPVELAFVGSGAKEDIARINALIAKHGDEWPHWWLKGRGLDVPAEKWLKSYRALFSEETA